MKESNKQRRTRLLPGVSEPLDYAVTYAPSERGDFKRRKATVVTGYAVFLLVILLLVL